ncbi:hypothetical protein IE53DRAFT_12305 [Violaceomyces palustris]|uniref:Uncharacterized protein n=1 Tax=Violaceomyces palustris TaxID=1673888 RepID=A0ACD0NLM3_9BASI|nr:hypothetical protein IE53DRAFT_12305 [Violaceomyces palustris]
MWLRPYSSIPSLAFLLLLNPSPLSDCYLPTEPSTNSTPPFSIQSLSYPFLSILIEKIHKMAPPTATGNPATTASGATVPTKSVPVAKPPQPTPDHKTSDDPRESSIQRAVFTHPFGGAANLRDIFTNQACSLCLPALSLCFCSPTPASLSDQTSERARPRSFFESSNEERTPRPSTISTQRLSTGSHYKDCRSNKVFPPTAVEHRVKLDPIENPCLFCRHLAAVTSSRSG